ncbi:CRISPR-associated protein Csx16 [Shewanella sp. 4t3-1-2LB]|jgi:CRISPR-associated protein Csx16|uniref:CRISPR-associated protein Csx16 n=1 Tax=Shewanella sp. 4t3-1-2LB TaxID=2817682 RepID=UPI001A98C83C|nr:CRISPR-associated protein Csx16 [Shewanella sp. 4t3-1-2LB]MBO1270826.1 CRISPR-associated protein Csx16 [Shewanella sp. 4t3-1-2LB]
MVYLVCRHPGAVEWCARQGVYIDKVIPHLSLEQVQPGDTVIGVLPLQLAAEVCDVGAKFFHLSIALPESLRGVELTADVMEQLGAKLQPFGIKKL